MAETPSRAPRRGRRHRQPRRARDILRTAHGLAGDGADRLDLKITARRAQGDAGAFRLFAPFTRRRRKVTIFGSARTHTDDPLYDQARGLAHDLADAGWWS